MQTHELYDHGMNAIGTADLSMDILADIGAGRENFMVARPHRSPLRGFRLVLVDVVRRGDRVFFVVRGRGDIETVKKNPEGWKA